MSGISQNPHHPNPSRPRSPFRRKPESRSQRYSHDPLPTPRPRQRPQRRFAPELAIIKLRRIAEAVANDWTPSDPPEPADVIPRIVKAGFRLTIFASLRRCLDDTRRKSDVPLPNTIVLRLLPRAGNDRYYPLLRWDLPEP